MKSKILYIYILIGSLLLSQGRQPSPFDIKKLNFKESKSKFYSSIGLGEQMFNVTLGDDAYDYGYSSVHVIKPYIHFGPFFASLGSSFKVGDIYDSEPSFGLFTPAIKFERSGMFLEGYAMLEKINLNSYIDLGANLTFLFNKPGGWYGTTFINFNLGFRTEDRNGLYDEVYNYVMDDNQTSTNEDVFGIKGVHFGVSIGHEWITSSIY